MTNERALEFMKANIERIRKVRESGIKDISSKLWCDLGYAEDSLVAGAGELGRDIALAAQTPREKLVHLFGTMYPGATLNHGALADRILEVLEIKS